MRTQQLIISILLLVLSVGSSHADVICKPQEPPVVSGLINSGDFDLLIDCLATFAEISLVDARAERREHGVKLTKVGWVYFNSVGGDVNEAIKMGRFLRESLAEVVVSEECLSACFLSVMGAVKLHAGEPFGKVGIHRVYYPQETLRDVDSYEYEVYYNQIKRGMTEYFRDLDIPQKFSDLMFSVPSDKIYYLSADDFIAVGKHPAYDEWISAKCKTAVSAKDFEKCADQVRWEKFRSTIKKFKNRNL